MSLSDAIDLLFGGMDKVGPGLDRHTLHVLGLLPERPIHIVADAGCGKGRQTLALAGELGVVVHAIDTYQPFLDHLTRRARKAGLGHLVRAHCLDMLKIPSILRHVDLLWSEGAVYNVGFANALAAWAPVVNPGGFVVVSELAWVCDEAPAEVGEFFAVCYPGMMHTDDNVTLAESAGYHVLFTHALPRDAWVDGLYDVLRPRARALLDHPDPEVKGFAEETLREIEIFDKFSDSYAYIFYGLER